jgi:hypothetical protein
MDHLISMVTIIIYPVCHILSLFANPPLTGDMGSHKGDFRIHASSESSRA